MKTIKNILLVGAGAIGMLHAVKLFRLSGVDFRLAVDPERKLRYRRDGRFFNGERFDFQLHCPAQDEGFSPDLVIFATKSWQLTAAAKMVEKTLSPDTIILPLLNGISATDILQSIFPKNHILYGYFLGHASVRQNNIVTHDGVGADHLGYLDNHEIAPEVAAVVELWKRAAIDCVVDQDMASSLWKKYILNVGVNQSTAYFEVNYGDLQKSPEKLAFAEKLMREALCVAQALQIHIDEAAVDAAMQVILSMPENAETSMYQDVKNSRPTEVELFAGTLCQLGEKYHIALPANRKVLAHFSK